MGRYICEVKKDHIKNELELVHKDRYDTNKGSVEEGTIKFDTPHEMHKYFHHHCISEDKLVNNGNNLFMFLFFILLLIFIVTIICQMVNKSGNDVVSQVGKTTFGKFSF